MNAHLHPPSRNRSLAVKPQRNHSKSHKTASHELRKPWFGGFDTDCVDHYNEEWLAFFKEQTAKKANAKKNRKEPESRPRVWNIPHN
jgi:hypothetical protein